MFRFKLLRKKASYEKTLFYIFHWLLHVQQSAVDYIRSNPELVKVKRTWQIFKIDFLHNDVPREQISFHLFFHL